MVELGNKACLGKLFESYLPPREAGTEQALVCVGLNATLGENRKELAIHDMSMYE